MKKQVILFGAPGSGKGSQAKYLVKEYGFKHLSTGDILRAEVKKGTDLGVRIAGRIEKGELVSDEIILELLQANLDLDNNRNFWRTEKVNPYWDVHINSSGDWTWVHCELYYPF